MKEFSRFLSKLDGDVQEQINQILSQLRTIQEETEDMVRELDSRITRIAEQGNQMTEVK